MARGTVKKAGAFSPAPATGVINIKESILGFYSRRIVLEEDGQKIEVSGKVQKNQYKTKIQLLVNGKLQDELYSTPANGVFGCEVYLDGCLENEIPVRVKLRAHFFMRPEYTFYVNGVEVYQVKGTWGGL